MIMDYIKEIRAIESEMFLKMGRFSQITIDIVQESEYQLSDKENIDRDTIGAICYQTSITLDIFNPELENDISILQKLLLILRSWQSTLPKL